MYSITAACSGGKGEGVISINLLYSLSFTLRCTQELVSSFPSNLSAQVVMFNVSNRGNGG